MKERKEQRASRALLWFTALALLCSNVVGLQRFGLRGFISFIYELVWNRDVKDIHHLYGTWYPMFFILTSATAVYCVLKLGWRRLTLLDIDPALIFYLCVISAAYLLLPFYST